MESTAAALREEADAAADEIDGESIVRDGTEEDSFCKLPLACANKIFRVNPLVPRAYGTELGDVQSAPSLWSASPTKLSRGSRYRR